jgi:hypothetical protein
MTISAIGTSSRSVDAPPEAPSTPGSPKRTPNGSVSFAGLFSPLSPQQSSSPSAIARKRATMAQHAPRLDMSYLSDDDGGRVRADDRGALAAAAAAAAAEAAAEAEASAGGPWAAQLARHAQRLSPAAAFRGTFSSHHSLRRKVLVVMDKSSWDFIVVILALVSCFFYVRSTYDPDSVKNDTSIRYNSSTIIDWVITALFTLDYALRLFVASNRLYYVFSPMAVIDLVSCVPIYVQWHQAVSGSSGSQGATFLRAVRMLRVLRIVRSFRLLNKSMSETTRVFASFGLTILTLIFVGAATFQVVEMDLFDEINGYARANYDASLLPLSPGKIFFFDAIWYMIVTIFTIGYGDFYAIVSSATFRPVVFPSVHITHCTFSSHLCPADSDRPNDRSVPHYLRDFHHSHAVRGDARPRFHEPDDAAARARPT